MTSSEVVQPQASPRSLTGTSDLATAVALALGLVGPGITNAQTSSGSAIEDIVVTAEFRQTNVQDTPIAITAVNSETMDARSQVSVFEIAAQAPNVTLKPAGQAFGPSLVAFIRGIGQTDFNYALEPGVGIYIDDIYYPTLTGSLVDLLDLDRVEVLRGPQGTLAGKNSIGGSIKLFSQEPTGEGGGSIAATYGSYNRIDVRASGDFAIVPDKLFARIAGVSKHRDGYVTRLDYRCMHPTSKVPTFLTGKISDCKLGTEGGQSYTAGRLALRWLVNEDLDVKFTADITNDDSETQPNVLLYVNEGLTAAGTGPFTFAGGFQGTSIVGTDGNPIFLTNAFVPYGRYRGDTVVNDPFISYATYIDPNSNSAAYPIQQYSPSAIEPISTLDDWGLSMVIDWSLSERFSLKSITSYRAYDSTFAQDIDGSPIVSQMLLQHLKHDQWSQELRLNGSAFDDKVDFTLGGFMFEQDGTLEANVNLYYVQFNFIHGPDTTPSHNYAGFLHATWHVADALNVSAGLRYSDDKKTYTHFRRNPDGSLPQDATPSDPTTTCIGPPHNVINPPNCALFGLFDKGATWQDDRVDWRVALDYRWNDSVMTYVQVATGYKGGGVNPRPFVLAQLLPFNSEELLSYEVGFKTMLFDRRMRFNGAVFVN
ncbi:MAG: TonB-dependent receptor, partial [Gammaproteobacteria bacterium]|nr:TonB-dependent receptor [Gammaproteobacteria bacterium]